MGVNASHQVAWSLSHSNVISSGSADRTWRMWQINDKVGSLLAIEDPSSNNSFYIGAEELAQCGSDCFASSVVRVLSSPVSSSSYFGVSSTGELVCNEVKPPLLDVFMNGQ